MVVLPSNVRLVLASASPRRRQILQDRGYQFELADPGEVEESISHAPTPEQLAIEKARVKAEAVAAKLHGPRPALVIGVDTLCAEGDRIIGKPLDRADAIAILTRLAGTRHRVISGLCVQPVLKDGAGAPLLRAETTWVTMRRVPREEIEAYVATGEADGKAGAYAVQENGDKFVEKIEGSFLNVVGFPLEMFERELPLLLKTL
ncbi:MAG TPA: Maf family protein [Planctomycetota bacterium]|nr:Maf family protein [Planctomycetota bacterium]